MTFYLTNTPPLPVPHLDVDIRTLYYRLVCLHFSCLRIPFGQDRQTELSHSVDSGVFQVFDSKCYSTDTTCEQAYD